MKLRPALIFLSVLVSGLTLALAVVQHRELASLRVQELAPKAQWAEPLPAASPANSQNPIVIAAQQHTPPAELLRLRGEVGVLERRKRELVDVGSQNEQLRAQFATKATNVPGGIALPPGYMRKADAKFVGYGTPEATVQSFLWAIQNRDVGGFARVFGPEMASTIEARSRSAFSTEEFFKEMDLLPGLRIVGREQVADDLVVLIVEILPGESHQSKFRLKQLEGQWKLISGL